MTQKDHQSSAIFYAVNLLLSYIKNEMSTDALTQLSNMIKSFQFTGSNFTHRNNDEKSSADLVLESMNTISFEVGFSIIYESK